MPSDLPTRTVKTHPDAIFEVAFPWLLKLRWGAVICQILLLLAVYLFFDTGITLVVPAVIIGFQATSNFVFVWLQRKGKFPSWLFNLIMFLDVTLLTGLLYSTGGPMNPFTFLYLIHIVVGAILMPTSWAWGLALFTVLCYGALFFLPPDLISLLTMEKQITCHVETGQNTQEVQMHLQGMWVAFSITAFFIVFFVNRIQRSLTEHKITIENLKEEKARSEKLASLATLAAGAAHEFSTPLSTIAVAAGEMLYTLNAGDFDQDLVDDARLIREQVESCREILYQMSADAGEHLGEEVQLFSIKELMNEIAEDVNSKFTSTLLIDNQTDNLEIQMPLRTIKRTIRGLVKNGFDASPPGSSVQLTCRNDRKFLYFTVKDMGSGMDESIQAKATEPFFTTKEPGKGLGLGLFLAKSFVESFGGSLTIISEPGQGTEVTISFDLAAIKSD
ncbi:MAG: sensor histidine kinase [Proteobacteria bacterium]|nr:sensor histidine kinase [Pseudomonadota bacterium]MBU1714770.1 sensor histidine kinase [Pseudomonadota bacterium]